VKRIKQVNAFLIAPDGRIVAIYMAVDGEGIVPIAENSEGIDVSIENGNGGR
jgi:hypothetical protein